MSQLLVISRIGVNRVRNTVLVSYRYWACGTRKVGNERIPDAETTNIMRADIANFCGPASSNFALDREVPLLSVRSISVAWNTGKGGQINRAVFSTDQSVSSCDV